MIPKVMNFFWSGDRMTFMRYMTLHSFRAMNPDFPVTLWSPAAPCIGKTWSTSEMDDSGYRGEDYLPLVDNLQVERRTWGVPFPGISHSQASDLFEWWLLFTEGGFYCDMDMLWLHPLSNLQDEYWHADVLCCLECDGSLFAIGFFGATPGCSVFHSIYETAKKNYVSRKYESAGAHAVKQAAGGAGSAQDTVDRFRLRHPHCRISCLPDDTFYHFHCRNYPAIFTTISEIPPHCLGLHWFGGGPVSQQWNQLLTLDNYQDHDNTFTRYCRKILELKGVMP